MNVSYWKRLRWESSHFNQHFFRNERISKTLLSDSATMFLSHTDPVINCFSKQRIFSFILSIKRLDDLWKGFRKFNVDNTTLFSVYATRFSSVGILSRVDWKSSEVSCYTLTGLWCVFARKTWSSTSFDVRFSLNKVKMERATRNWYSKSFF